MTVKKLLSLFMIIAATVTALPVTAFAAERNIKTSAAYELSGETTTLSPTSNILQTSSQSGDFMFGQQLRGNAKDLYDAFCKIEYTDTSVEVSLSEPLEYNVGFFVSAEEMTTAGNDIGVSVQCALDAALMDYPEIFWLKFGSGGTSFEYSYTHNFSYFKVIGITLYLVTDDVYADDLKGHVEALNSAVEDFTVEGNDRYTLLKAIHDKLADEVVYVDAAFAHEPYGALIEKQAVCEGYAEAFILICRKYGIPCVGVLGTSVNSSGNTDWHKWNLVQMEDEKWYAVDVTWDDTPFKIYYDYFLVGSDSIDKNYSGNKFSQTHFPVSDFSGTGASNFEYPELNQTAYIYSVPKAEDITVASYTFTSVNLTENSGEEYMIEGGTWQNNGYFDGLAPNIPYKFYSRVASDGIYPSGSISEACFMLIGASVTPTLLTIDESYVYGIAPETPVQSCGLTLFNSETALTPEQTVFTGNTFTVFDTVYTVIIKGDATCDGQINSTDFMRIRRQFLGLFEMTDLSKKAADVNLDQSINSTDFMLIRRHYLGLHDIFSN